MPIIRNPFRKSPADVVPGDADLPISSQPSSEARTSTSSAGQSGTKKERPVLEYKLSEISDSGVYLPPSPTEKTSFWSTRSSSSANTARTAFSETEPFNISRESFDSYRRSFDISARSPVLGADVYRARHSLDARKARLPTSALPLRENHINLPETQPEEFEDVGLDDAQAKPKKPGFLSRFAGSSHDQAKDSSRPTSAHHGTGLFGRKRGTSGQGAELASVPGPQPPQGTEVAAATDEHSQG